MKFPFFLAAAAWCLLGTTSLPATKPKPASSTSPDFKPATDDVVRLQIYLDEQNFGPGKIDGRYGGFTAKSWHNFQQSRGANPISDKFDAKTFTSVDPTYVTYTATADDLNAIGEVPKELKLQEKQKALPYTSMAELLGERYHVGVDFLHEINRGHDIDHLKAGDTVKVPNIVPPFNLAQVLALRQYTAERKKALAEAQAKQAAEKTKPSQPDSSPAASPAGTPPEEMPGPTVALSASPPAASAVPSVPPVSPDAVPDATPDASPTAATADNRPTLRATPANSKHLVFYVNTTQSYLEVHDGDHLVACFPITPGSSSIPTPKGEWHVVEKTLLPEFRWDKSVLMTGKRSDTAYQLPPGPNNPVGITWIALNKPGIGMHGTATPDTIGRSASHGCIRLSNWDAFKVFGMVAPGTKVIIE